jgi:hypothetical protein
VREGGCWDVEIKVVGKGLQYIMMGISSKARKKWMLLPVWR